MGERALKRRSPGGTPKDGLPGRRGRYEQRLAWLSRQCWRQSISATELSLMAMPDDNDAPALVVILQVVIPSSLHIERGQIGLCGKRRVVQAVRGYLAINRRKNSTSRRKSAHLRSCYGLDFGAVREIGIVGCLLRYRGA